MVDVIKPVPNNERAEPFDDSDIENILNSIIEARRNGDHAAVGGLSLLLEMTMCAAGTTVAEIRSVMDRIDFERKIKALIQ